MLNWQKPIPFRDGSVTETLELKGEPGEELAPLYQEIQQLYREIKRPQLEELQKVMQLLAEFYQMRQVAYDRLLTIQGNRMASQGSQCQEIVLSEERSQKLLEYQAEMRAFTVFLKKKYLSCK